MQEFKHQLEIHPLESFSWQGQLTINTEIGTHEKKYGIQPMRKGLFP